MISELISSPFCFIFMETEIVDTQTYKEREKTEKEQIVQKGRNRQTNDIHTERGRVERDRQRLRAKRVERGWRNSE